MKDTSAGRKVQARAAKFVHPHLAGLRASGILTMTDLRKAVEDASQRAVDLVEGLILRRTISLLVGDSTVGKTPLLILLGLCIAFGKQFLGRQVQCGRVFYVDGESDQQGFVEMVETIAQFLGESSVPDSFMMWSPNWDGARPNVMSLGQQALIHARHAAADFTVIDPFRTFFPSAESDAREAMKVITELRKFITDTESTVVLPHHIRKADRKGKRPDLEKSPREWLEEAAGSRALINNTDLRLGMEARDGDGRWDAVLCGFRRRTGQVGPLYVHRIRNDDGDPHGYALVDGAGLLSTSDQLALYKLPDPERREPFHFKDAQTALGGNSGSNTSRFLRRCIDLGLIVRSGEQYLRV